MAKRLRPPFSLLIFLFAGRRAAGRLLDGPAAGCLRLYRLLFMAIFLCALRVMSDSTQRAAVFSPVIA